MTSSKKKICLHLDCYKSFSAEEMLREFRTSSVPVVKWFCLFNVPLMCFRANHFMCTVLICASHITYRENKTQMWTYFTISCFPGHLFLGCTDWMKTWNVAPCSLSTNLRSCHSPKEGWKSNRAVILELWLLLQSYLYIRARIMQQFFFFFFFFSHFVTGPSRALPTLKLRKELNWVKGIATFFLPTFELSRALNTGVFMNHYSAHLPKILQVICCTLQLLLVSWAIVY